MGERRDISVFDLVAEMLSPLEGLIALDMGAGSGRASRMLARLGADVTGIEPQAEAVEAARTRGGGPVYRVGTAESTGLDDGSADLVFFSFSLHHCPDPDAALREALRLLRTGGRLAVLEPEASGACHDTTCVVDDETEELAGAQAALAACLAAGGLKDRRSMLFRDRSYYASADALIETMLAVDPTRSVSDEARAHVAAHFRSLSEVDGERRYLPYFGRLDIAVRP